MKTILLFDPLIIGHHLTYTANIINWALSRDYAVYFAGHGYEETFLFERYRSNPQVTFIEIDFSRDFGLSDSNVTYRDLYFSDCPISQCRFVLSLQKKLQPELTLFLYGDHMDFAWQDMLQNQIKFHHATYMIHLFFNTDYYHARATQFSKLFKSIDEQQLFDGIFVLDEYQAFQEPGNSRLHFLPDPFRDHSLEPGSVSNQLSAAESNLINRLNDFLYQDDRKILLIIGWFSRRKNIHWLLELADRHKELSFVMIGKRVTSELDAQIDDVLNRLKSDGRLFYHSEFVSPYVFDELLGTGRVDFLALPYSRHFGSSALHLLGLHYGLPALVPDIGLMGIRTELHNLGLIFTHDDKDDFQAKFDDLLKSNTKDYQESIAAFMQHFSQDRLFSALDRGFGNSHAKSDLELEVQNKLAEMGTDPSQEDNYVMYLQSALSSSHSGHHENSLQQIEKAASLCPGNPGLLLRKSLILQNLGDLQGSFNCLNAIKLFNAENVELVDYERGLLDFILYEYGISALKGNTEKDHDFHNKYFSFICFHADSIDPGEYHKALEFLFRNTDLMLKGSRKKFLMLIRTRQFKLAFLALYVGFGRYFKKKYFEGSHR